MWYNRRLWHRKRPHPEGQGLERPRVDKRLSYKLVTPTGTVVKMEGGQAIHRPQIPVGQVRKIVFFL